MRWMAPVVIIGGSNYILGIAGLVNLNYNNYFLKAVTVSGLISLILLIITIPLLDVYSGALAMIMAEIILFLCGNNAAYGLTPILLSDIIPPVASIFIYRS